jgi:hypothetical protein
MQDIMVATPKFVSRQRELANFLPKFPHNVSTSEIQHMRMEEIRVQVLCLGRDVVVLDAVAGMKK